MKYKHLFGPVPSRRLGLSLGVDLVPHKTCTLNCVYCECGETTNLTADLKEYIPVQPVIDELDNYLSTAPKLDYITFSGSGEPTLNIQIGKVVDYIKTNFPRYRICLLTNGTLFTASSVRSAVSRIDLIIPSLDAASENTFARINRPHNNIDCASTIDGLIKLRREYSGKIILEILFVKGLNDSPEELLYLNEAIERINPDRVQIGTLDRPGTEDWVEEADSIKMKEIADFLYKAELIGEFRPSRNISSCDDSQNSQIIRTLQRRPCTIKDLQQILNLRPVEIQKQINYLLERGTIEAEKKERGIFFKIRKNSSGSPEQSCR